MERREEAGDRGVVGRELAVLLMNGSVFDGGLFKWTF